MNYETVLIQKILRENAPKITKSLMDSEPLSISSKGGVLGERINLFVTAEERVLFDNDINGFSCTIKVADSSGKHISHTAIADKHPLTLSKANSMKELDANYQEAVSYIEYFIEQMKINFFHFLADNRNKIAKQLETNNDKGE